MRTGDFIVAKFPAPDVRSSAQKQLRQIFGAKWMPDALTSTGIDKPSIERIVGVKKDHSSPHVGNRRRP